MNTQNKKFFILDTNILLDAPYALFAFDDNIVILTEAVLEELDSFKRESNNLGINARIVIRELESLRNNGSLIEGIPINNNGYIKIETNHHDIQLPPNWTLVKADHRILQVCKGLQEQGHAVRLITNDILLRIKCDIINIIAEGFLNDQAPPVHQQYTGRTEIFISDDDLNKFFTEQQLKISETQLFTYNNDGVKLIHNQPKYAHEFVLLRSFSGSTGIGKIDANNEYIKSLEFKNFYPYGIIPKNVGQQFMIEALMQDVPLTIIHSPAGCGKTLLALAAGLEHTLEDNKYRKILICRPTIPLGGKDLLGFLPGTEKDKIDPYFRSVLDNLEILVDSDAKARYANETILKNKIQYIFDKDYIDMQAIAFLRGRSITKQYVFLDEMQNTTSAEIKSIVTRAGEGTKFVICGDPQQIDLPFLSETNNGLSWLSERMKGSPYCIQLTLFDNECVRSKLAKEAIKRLN